MELASLSFSHINAMTRSFKKS
nr:hypothetical protein [Mycoplasmopsis bovis]